MLPETRKSKILTASVEQGQAIVINTKMEKEIAITK